MKLIKVSKCAMLLLWVALVATVPSASEALILEAIAAAPEANPEPFWHSLLHTSTGCGGACGSILAWLQFAPFTTLANFSGSRSDQKAYYNTDGGPNSFEMGYNIRSSFTGPNFVGDPLIGAAKAVGHGLKSSDFSNSLSDVPLGHIDWQVQVNNINGVAQNLIDWLTNEVNSTQNNGIFSFRTYYLDKIYTGSPTNFGLLPNGFNGNTLALWGSGAEEGQAIDVDTDGSMGGFNNAKIGTDLGFTFSPLPLPPNVATVPEPGTMALLATGLAGVLGCGYRQRKARA